MLGGSAGIVYWLHRRRRQLILQTLRTGDGIELAETPASGSQHGAWPADARGVSAQDDVVLGGGTFAELPVPTRAPAPHHARALIMDPRSAMGMGVGPAGARMTRAATVAEEAAGEAACAN